jgi:hypothetical protein
MLPGDGLPHDKTAAHRDHLHVGMTKDGATERTSFRRR